jgi:hypothetical protein
MTADLLLAPPAPVEPAPAAPPVERILCDSCSETFPLSEAEYHEPSERWLCLDDLDAVLAREDDQRNANHYYYR